LLLTRTDFHQPTLDDAEPAMPAMRRDHHRFCDFSFVNSLIWRSHFHTVLAIQDEFVFLKFGRDNPAWVYPLGGGLERGMALLFDMAEAEKWQMAAPEKLRIFGWDKAGMAWLENRWPGRFTFTTNPADWDYLYRTADLAGLPGKKYHQKRNHIAAFTRAHSWEYETLEDGNLDEVLEMADLWWRSRNATEPENADTVSDASASLTAENTGIHEVLEHRRVLGVEGGVIRCGGRVAAFTFGSPPTADTFDIHVEKALPEFAGAYTVINREFAANELLGRFDYINRENDMGLEGLRKAKHSYHPAEVLEKYIAIES